MLSRFSFDKRRTYDIIYAAYSFAVVISIFGALYFTYGFGTSLESLRSILPAGVFESFDTLKYMTYFVAGTLVAGLVIVIPILRTQSRDQEHLTERAATLEVEATTDALTGLYNRRYFEEALDSYLAEFEKIDKPLGLLILDLDHFKKVNDNHGHDVGDLVLMEVASRLMQLTREHDIVARLGGEEFAVVAPFASESQIFPFAERFCKMIAELKVPAGNVVLRPTVSIGVAVSTDGISTAKELIKRADERLYEAKRSGRNRVCA